MNKSNILNNYLLSTSIWFHWNVINSLYQLSNSADEVPFGIFDLEIMWDLFKNRTYDSKEHSA